MDYKERYAKALRDGKVEEADKIYWESKEDDKVEENVSVEVEEDGQGIQSFEEINGIGQEIADEMKEAFGDIKQLEEASLDELEDVSGIGPARAKDIKQQIK